jgi:hypothetical protein
MSRDCIGDSFSSRERLRLTSLHYQRHRWMVNTRNLEYLVRIGVHRPDPDWRDSLPVVRITSVEPKSAEPLLFRRPPDK